MIKMCTAKRDSTRLNSRCGAKEEKDWIILIASIDNDLECNIFIVTSACTYMLDDCGVGMHLRNEMNMRGDNVVNFLIEKFNYDQ